MSYCLNPACQKPQNRDTVECCRNCGARLLLKDRYRPLKPIGQGGFGRTFLAIDEDKPSKPRCVIKQFLPVTQNPRHVKKAAQMFEQEALRLEELGNHPQIPTLLAHFSQDQQQYLVQEFISGKTLAELLAEEGAFTEAQVRMVLLSLLPVLDFIHAHSVIHRDIKPANIIRRDRGRRSLQSLPPNQPDWTELLHVLSLETAQGFRDFAGPQRFSERLSHRLAQPPPDLTIADYSRWQTLASHFAVYATLSPIQRQYLVADASRLLYEMRQRYEPLASPIADVDWVLVDFGAAKAAIGTALVRTGTTIGSPEYVAPEQSRGKAIFASDLYSLGVTCVQLLTNRSPFDLFDTSEDAWIWRRCLLQPVSDQLGRVLDRLLEPGVNRRYPSAAAVLSEFEPLPLVVPNAPKPEPMKVAPAVPVVPIAVPDSLKPDSPRQVRSHAAPTPALANGSNPIPPLAATVLPAKPRPVAKSSKAARSWQLTHQLVSMGKVYAIALSPVEPLLASTSGTTIKLWDTQTGQPLRTLTGHVDIVYCLAISPDGRVLISGSADKSIRLWDLQNGQRLGTIALHTDTVLSLAISPDGSTLASSSLHDPTKLWDLRTNREVSSLTGQTGRIESLAFSPDGQWLASGSSEATIALWDLQQTSLHSRELRLLKGHSQPVVALAFDLDGKTLASGSWDGTVKLWSSRTRREKRSLQAMSGRVGAIAISSDGKWLATGSDALQLWQPRTGKLLTTLTEPAAGISAIAITTDSHTIASSRWDGTICLWEWR